MTKMRMQSGVAIAEFGAALVILIPVVLTSALAAIVAFQAYMIHSALNQSATLAARRLAISYCLNPEYTMANTKAIFKNITNMQIVKSEDQFEVPTGNAGWNLDATPPTVTVVVTFKSGQYGCAAFPNPDPLKMGNSFKLTARATASLE
ncbi:MAG: hypothetical protein SFY67_18750 [Candidatus Melainabacteria bacterium]|nr:hypothetical protein [Candidatus Melainabacteria bacterium]